MAEEIRDRLVQVRQRIGRVAERVGRSADQVTLITVSKTFAPSIVQQAVDAGARELGENRVQEAVPKMSQIQGNVRWHLIGHLQSNKARHAVESFDVIHTVDSVQLAERLDRLAGECERRPSVLVQVDLAHEPTKTGVDEDDLPELVEALDRSANLDFGGLMVMPPFFDSPEQTRPYFRKLGEILKQLNESRSEANRLTELSMGMTHDFEVAIEEGATMVRVGTAIFGTRTND